MQKLKTYVLTTSKVFMKDHPRAGEPTGFREAILLGRKIHTIRSGDYWEKVVREVNRGNAFLSIREWTGRPYTSKQDEYQRFYKLGWEPIEIDRCGVISINGFYTEHDLEFIAGNDGLSEVDMHSWFKMGQKEFAGGIIHFTDFRYG